MNALEFLVGWTVFLIFSVWIFNQIGVTVFSGVPDIQALSCTISSTTCPSGDYLCGIAAFFNWILQMIGCAITGIQLFFTLMTINSGFGIVGTILVAALTIGLIYIVINLIPFVGKGT